jgi:DNA-binding NtrC family response regulator
MKNLGVADNKGRQAILDLVRFHTSGGKIWLGEQRMLLFQLAEFTALRTELISLLGMERAKGFMLRLGYQAGLQDAIIAKDIGLENITDAFLIGPQLHALKGMTNFDPIKIEINADNGTFYAEVEWVDSFEVEAGLGSEHESCACWMLQGYAYSYSSKMCGQEIIFKEVSCRGCGAERCMTIGKPAHQWEDAEDFRKYFITSSLVDELEELKAKLDGFERKEAHCYGIGESLNYRKVCKDLDKAVNSKVTVLLEGETGVGKEVVARSLHERSQRSSNSFVAVNCAAIPSELIEAELFGVEKGAYTGATHSRMGRFERANGGTLFLDEVAELSSRAQAALLRVLQENEYERVGDNRTRSLDVRIIAATNEDLSEAVKQKKFRADLYFRLNVFSVKIPPLRERRQDIPLLANYFLEKYEKQYHRKQSGFSDKALNMLGKYSWPGNIRELENVIERGVIVSDNHVQICVEHLFPQLPVENFDGLNGDGSLCCAEPSQESKLWAKRVLEAGLSLSDLETAMIQQAMLLSENNITHAADRLGITRPALAYRLKQK